MVHMRPRLLVHFQRGPNREKGEQPWDKYFFLIYTQSFSLCGLGLMVEVKCSVVCGLQNVQSVLLHRQYIALNALAPYANLYLEILFSDWLYFAGQLCTIDDENCTHIVVDNTNTLPDNIRSSVHIVKADWFWSCVQMEICADEHLYLATVVRTTYFTHA